MFRLVRVCFILVCVLVAAAGGSEMAQAHVRLSSSEAAFIRQSTGTVETSTNNPGLYFPLLMNGVSGWTSVIYAVHAGTASRTFVVRFYRSDGFQTASEMWFVDPKDMVKLPLDLGGRLPVGTQGTAVITDAGHDIVGHSNLKNQGELANYSGLGDAGTAGPYDVIGISSAIYGPSFKNQYNGRSTLAYIQNTTVNPLNVTVTIWDEVGAPNISTVSMPGRGLAVIASGGCASGHICSLKVQSNDNTSLLAGAILELGSNGLERAANEMFSKDYYTIPILLPIVKYQYGSQPMSSGIRVQNIGNSNVTPKADFYGGNLASQCSVQAAAPLAPGQAVTLDPGLCMMVANTYAYGRIVAISYPGNNQPFAVQVNETSTSGTSKKKAYSAPNPDPLAIGASTIYAPLVYNATISGLTWLSGITITCFNNSEITLQYYRTDGTPLNPIIVNPPSSATPYNIAPPANFEGSLEITNTNVSMNPFLSTRCSGVVNTTNGMPNQETQGLYTMVNR